MIQQADIFSLEWKEIWEAVPGPFNRLCYGEHLELIELDDFSKCIFRMALRARSTEIRGRVGTNIYMAWLALVFDPKWRADRVEHGRQATGSYDPNIVHCSILGIHFEVFHDPSFDGVGIFFPHDQVLTEENVAFIEP